jgi:hypothetical protein
MNRFRLLAAALAIVFTAASSRAGDPPAKITGEVIDVACYTDHGAKGAKHQECATTCIKGGSPAGLLDKDGKVYVLAGKDHTSPVPKIEKYIAQQVTITGKLNTKGGVNVLVIDDVEPAK